MQPIIHHPFVFRLGPVELSGFTIAIALAFVVGHVILRREIARRGHDPRPVTDTVISGLFGFIVGAKLYYALLTGDPSTLLRPGGLVFWAGATGGVLAGFWTSRRRGMPIMRIADPTGIGLAAGYAIGRTGCFAVGDDYGRPWNSAFAVAFPQGQPPSSAANLVAHFGVSIAPGAAPWTLIAVHPTQLYEAALGLVMFFLLWRLRDHGHAEGWLFGVYMVLAGTERFLIEFVRAKDDYVAPGLTVAQITAVVIAVVGARWMAARWRVRLGASGIYAMRTTDPGAAKDEVVIA
jgi:phosphatidylglycerol:prolipoprotein diacylglycerol transferase